MRPGSFWASDLDGRIARGRATKVSARLDAIPHGATQEDINRIGAEHAAWATEGKPGRKKILDLARGAGVRAPSPETWATVIEELRARTPPPFPVDDPMASVERVVCDDCEGIGLLEDGTPCPRCIERLRDDLAADGDGR